VSWWVVGCGWVAVWVNRGWLLRLLKSREGFKFEVMRFGWNIMSFFCSVSFSPLIVRRSTLDCMFQKNNRSHHSSSLRDFGALLAYLLPFPYNINRHTHETPNTQNDAQISPEIPNSLYPCKNNPNKPKNNQNEKRI
jgi:hypothetical protein